MRKLDKLDWYLIGSIVLSLVLLQCAFTPKARAQDHEAGHDLYHDNAYSKWQKPDGTGSCCNLRVLNKDGIRISGDCYPTEARPIIDKDGYQIGWLALKDNGSWVTIPEKSILHRTINPDDSGVSAHLCESYGQIHCFLPPAGTM